MLPYLPTEGPWVTPRFLQEEQHCCKYLYTVFGVNWFSFKANTLLSLVQLDKTLPHFLGGCMAFSFCEHHM